MVSLFAVNLSNPPVASLPALGLPVVSFVEPSKGL
jgi:hypothetical protein